MSRGFFHGLILIKLIFDSIEDIPGTDIPLDEVVSNHPI